MRIGTGGAARRIAGVDRFSGDRCWTLVPWIVAMATVFVGGRGRLNFDTKYLLHVDARELMSLSRHVWDPLQYGGYVAHQAIGYLWPSGPFHAAGQWLGVAPWVMQRLWLAVVFAAAGSGVLAWLRSRGHGPLSATVAAVLYQTSPFVLAYQARTSLMLLPWASLGWLALITSRGVRTLRWRDSALAALLLGTAGGINATALILVVPSLGLIVLDELRSRRTSWRTSVIFAARSAVLGILLSLWWMATVTIQGRYGSRVLFFSETLEDVSLPATAFEIFRGFGYWLNYVGLDGSPVTSAAASSLASPVSVAATLVYPLAALVGILVASPATRRLAVGLVALGLLLAVNVHPIADPPRLWTSVAGSPDSWLALAFRSSTRATPVLLLGASLGIAALLDSSLARFERRVFSARVTAGSAIALVCALGAVVGVPARLTAGVADTTLSRTTNLPSSWSTLGRTLESSVPPDQRVLQLPGQEFAKYDWGYTGESALLAAQDRPVLIRELLPLGDEQFMNLIGATNDAALEGRLDTPKLSDLSRLLAVGAVVIPSDLDDSFYGTPDQATLIDTNQLGASTPVGEHRVLGIDTTSGVMRTQHGDAVVLGDGYGLVASAGWDLLGQRTIRYAADMADDDLESIVSGADSVIVTDTNRIRAQHWRSTRDWYGFSEDGTDLTRLLRSDVSDRRLEVFADSRLDDATLMQQRGPVTVRASDYGSPLRLRPEARAFASIDGFPTTAWSVETSEGGRPRLTLKADRDVSSVRIVQQQVPSRHRVAAIDISVDSGRPRRVELDGASMSPAGQLVPFGGNGRTVRIQVVAVQATGDPTSRDTVGFAEIDLGLGPTVEVGVLPTRGTEFVRSDSALSYVFSRDRAPGWDPERSDPETRVRREFVVPSARQFLIRASIDAPDLARLPGTISVVIDDRAVVLDSVGENTPGLFVGRSPLWLEPGPHLIDTVSSTLPIDETVVMSTPTASSSPSAAAPVRNSGADTPTHRSGVLTSCEEGCWFIFGESFNRGWTLLVDGADQGPPVRVDGGVNGWRLDSAADGTAVTLRFRPQRIADIAQMISLGAAVLCLVIVVLARRRRGDLADAVRSVNDEPSGSPTLPDRSNPVRSSLRTALFRVALCAALGFLVLPDRWTVVVIIASLLSSARRDPSDVHVRTGVAGVVTSLLLGLMMIAVVPPPASFVWSLTADRVHAAIMASVVLMVVGVALDSNDDGRTGVRSGGAT